MIRLINIISIALVVVLFALNLIYLNEGRSPFAAISSYFSDDNTAETKTADTVDGSESLPANVTKRKSNASPKALPVLFNESRALLENEANNINVFHKVRSSVVHVTNNRLYQNYFTLDTTSVPQGSGTGIIWDKSGVILTNYHVIANAGQIIIKLIDQSTYEAKIIGMEPGKDLAVLKIDAPEEKLTPPTIGNSAILEVGRKVMAIGNPFGLDYTLTVGVVSALGREIKSPTNMTITGVIQTDAAINPGNSGGPLLNSDGELIGINTQIVSLSGGSSGIGFAIPINAVKRIMPMLIEFGKIMRPYVGVSLLDDNTARYYNISGVVIREVYKNSPAQTAGLKGITRANSGFYLGDIIVGFNDTDIHSTDDFFLALENYGENDPVSLKIKRNDQIHQIRLRLGKAQ